MNIVFAYPNFLWALFFGLVPLIIHLFNFRRYKTVYFSDTSLLEEVIQQSKSKREVKNWLLLILRTLLVLFLILLFAQPRLTNDNGSKKENYALIVLDNSPSMLRKRGNETLLNEAKYYADKIVQSYGADVKFKMLHLDNIEKAQFDLTKSAAQDRIAEVSASNKSFNPEVFSQKVAYIARDWGSKFTTYWLSDFHFDWSSSKLDSSFSNHALYQLQGDDLIDVYVDSTVLTSSATLESPYDEIKVFVKSESADFEKAIKVSVQEGTKNVAQSSLSLLDSNWLNLKIPSSQNANFKGSILIEGDAVSMNNRHHIAYSRKKVFKTLLVTNNAKISSAIRKLYHTEPKLQVQVVKFDRIPFEDLSDFQTIIVAEPEVADPGIIQKVTQSNNQQNLVFIPSIDKSEVLNNSYLNELGIGLSGAFEGSIEVGSFDKNAKFFDGVFEGLIADNLKRDIAQIAQYYGLKIDQRWQVLMRLENERPFLVQKDNIFVFSAALSNSNFFRKPICVPTFLKLGSMNQSQSNLSFEIGASHTWKYTKSVKSLNVIDPEGKTFNWLPSVGSSFEIDRQFSIPGAYTIIDGSDTVANIAMNIPNQEYRIVENSIVENGNVEFNKDIDDTLIREARDGKELWPYLIIAITLLILSEMWVSRWGRI